LRITLGKSIGGSPGNPYVFEIWPVGHSSSIHRHSNSFVVIKVLKGTINVKLFPELDIENTTPFQQINLREGDVTWGSPNSNQTHQVLNSAGQSVAITLQSYKYSHNDLIHYEFFDYIDRDRKTIEHFQPKSDCDFLEFKEIIKKEWGQFQSINL
jgi:quercetin dioxygenase-like cupin family protein